MSFDSRGKLPPFTSFGADLEAPGALARAASEIAYRGELILVCGDGSAYASPTALNTVLQFYALRLHHVLYLSDSRASCERLRRAVPSLACAWSSIINASKPAHGSVCVEKYWDKRFYFYNLRKTYLMRLTAELGLNVLQTDTDVAWFADPYPALKNGALRTLQLVTQGDLPLANAGIVYAQGVRRGGGAGWVLHETQARVRLFSLYPHLVPHFVAWARPPYFSNADEQTLLNDALASAISGLACYVFSTAIMEAKLGGAKRTNRSLRFGDMPEAAVRARVMAAIHASAAEHRGEYPMCGAPGGLQVCPRAGGAARRYEVRVGSYALHPPAAANASALAVAAAVDGAAAADTVAHAGGALGRAAAPPAADRFARAPSWLFQHYSYMKLEAAHAPAARESAAAAKAARRGAPSAAAGGGDDGWPRSFANFDGLPPTHMVHLAGVRSGAWSRRAILRAHGWWHAEADSLAGEALGWGQRRGVLLTSAAMLSRAASAAELETAVGNLLVLAALVGRTPVVPEVLCERMQGNPAPLRSRWLETRRRQGERRCAWVPPRACWQLEYVTAGELRRRAAADRDFGAQLHATRRRANASAADADETLARRFEGLEFERKRKDGTAEGGPTGGGSGGAGGGCAAAEALGRLLELSNASATGGRAAPAARRAQALATALVHGRLSELPCETAEVAVLADARLEEMLTRWALRPARWAVDAARAREADAKRPWGRPWAAANASAAVATDAGGDGVEARRRAAMLATDAACIDALLPREPRAAAAEADGATPRREPKRLRPRAAPKVEAAAGLYSYSVG